MRTVLRFSFVVAWILSGVLAAPEEPSAQPNQQLARLELPNSIVLSYPETWVPSTLEYSNASEMVVPIQEGDRQLILARMLVTQERRRDHEDALKRLQDIANETAEIPRFLDIGGWPALERTYSAPLARRGQNRSVTDNDVTPRVTTAIAADDLLIRLETTLSLETELRRAAPRLSGLTLVDQAMGIGRSAIFATQGQPAAIRREIETLRREWRPAPPQTPQP